MCPLQNECPFYQKFAHVRHEKLQQMVDAFCVQENGHTKCIHYQTHSLFGMKLDGNISPTCFIIPRPQSQ